MEIFHRKKFERLEFSFGSMNIQGGVENKISHEEVTDLITACDLFTLQETWLLPGESVNIPGFDVFKSNRKPKKKAKKGVDGVLVAYKNIYKKGISRQPSSNEKDIIWVRLDKVFFGFDNDIFVAAGYRPPREGVIGTFYKKTRKRYSKV